jgi:hypothetical protein
LKEQSFSFFYPLPLSEPKRDKNHVTNSYTSSNATFYLYLPLARGVQKKISTLEGLCPFSPKVVVEAAGVGAMSLLKRFYSSKVIIERMYESKYDASICSNMFSALDSIFKVRDSHLGSSSCATSMLYEATSV